VTCGEALYPCYQLMAVSGLRRGEAAALRWCDIDFAGATLTVGRQLQETGRGLVVLPPKSIASNRVVALDPWTLQVLGAHRDRQLPAPRDGVRLRPPGRPPLHARYLTRRFIRLVRRAGLPPIRLHDLRQGAATLALAGGADLKVIQAMLGHARIILTADTYTSVLPDLARTTAEAVAAQMPGSRSAEALIWPLRVPGISSGGEKPLRYCFALVLLTGRPKPQALVEGFRATRTGVIANRQPAVSASCCFLAQLFDRESSVTVALMLGADVEPPQVAVEQRVVMPGGERGHDKASQLVPVIDQPRPGDVRHRVGVGKRPGDRSNEMVLIGPQLQLAGSPHIVLSYLF
jgi:Phage integrase family